MDIYEKLQVRPPHNSIRLLKLPFGVELPLARWSWKIHGKLLPLLHALETGRPDDVFVNLRVLWCKLLISLDPLSPAYEGNDDTQKYATYRMLPPLSIKWALRYLQLWRIFPRWMHANIELRSAYLQTALETVLSTQHVLHNEDKVHNERTCAIVLGGGYDPKGAKLFTSYSNVECVYELDLPEVVDSKRGLLLRAGFDVLHEDNDKEQHTSNHGVRLEGVDLNDNEGVDRVLDKIRDELLAHAKNGAWRVLLISEALLLYLDPGKAERILKGVSERFGANTATSSFRGATVVFADRLMKHTESCDATSAGSKPSRRSMALPATLDEIEHETAKVRTWLEDSGWELKELLFKPGATRHLGIATC